jgi:hypothetical protein
MERLRRGSPGAKSDKPCRSFQQAEVLWLPGLPGQVFDQQYGTIRLVIGSEDAARQAIRDGSSHRLGWSVLRLAGGYRYLPGGYGSWVRCAARSLRQATSDEQQDRPC